MQSTIVLVIALVAAVVLAIGIVLYLMGRARAKRRTTALRDHFGGEYARVVQAHGRHKGETELQTRLQRRRELSIHHLSPEQRERFGKAWESAQTKFVDTPSTGLRDADLLVLQVMRDRGYPVEQFEDRAKLVSVDYPELVEHFRAAHSVAVDNEQDGASTEQLRQAMVDYRYLFDEMIEGGEPERTKDL